MKPLNSIFLFACFLVLTVNIGCKNKKASPDLNLASIDLARGELLLCGNGQFGEISFPLSCNNDSQETFDLAIALLHSFEYKEAEKAFAKVIDADPECAMAYWGAAMSIYHSLWSPPTKKELEKGSKLIEIAKTLTKTQREQQYVDAIGAYYNDWDSVDHKTRSLLYEKKMETIYNNNKEDIEAAVFYALALNSTADPTDKSYANQSKAGKILEGLFPRHPDHPGIAHYLIHNYDYPELAEKALSTARRYAEIAPASAHAQHMPSHIFTRLGLWNESIQSNLNSASSARCYAEESQMGGHWNQEIHALDYLVYAYLQQGDNVKANEQYEYLKTINNVNPADIASAVYPFTAIPARIALENKQWAVAAKIKPHASELDWEQFPWQKAIIHFARAIGSARSGDIVSAEKEADTLQSLHEQLVNIKDEYKAKQVLIQIKASQAWISMAKGNTRQAIAYMAEATDMEENTAKPPVTPGEVLPARELLGDLFLEMDKPQEALECYEIDLKLHPNRFNGIYGAAIAAKQSGNREMARKYFEKLVKLAENSNNDRPEIIEAKAFLGRNKIAT